MHIERNPNYIHHQKETKLGSTIREVVFGMEDGMVSTLGSITGIAAATREPYTILLAGIVIVSVESISMAVGSYLSSKSENEVNKRKLWEEKVELHHYPEEEKAELSAMYVADGWTKALADQMAEQASKNKKLFLKEMAYRELKVFPDNMESPVRNGIFMGVSYIIGGLIPLLPYVFLELGTAIYVSLVITTIGLFCLGAAVTKYSKRTWWKSGLEMLVLAGVAALIGYGVGQLVENHIGS